MFFGHASVIPRDQATVYSSCGESQESSVLNVNPGYTLHTNNQYKQTSNFSKEEIKDRSRNEGSEKVQLTDSNPSPHGQ